MKHIDPLEDLVGNLFDDRQEEFRLFEGWIEKIPRVHLNSFALIGRRRTGKTALLVKLSNCFYSNLAQFNALAKLVGFFGLPETK